jgi:outer membrane protein
MPIQGLAAQIAVIDLQKVLHESNPGKKAMQTLQEYQKDVRSELREKKKSLDNLKQEIQQQSMMLSEEAQQDKRSMFQKQAQRFRSSYKNYQQKMKQKEKDAREPIIDVLIQVVQRYGENNDFDIIMDKKNNGIMYNKEKLEITDIIIQKLNKAWEKRDKEIESSKQ